MRRSVNFRWIIWPGLLLAFAVLLLAQQVAPAKRVLVVNGHSVPDAVVQINGHFYVDINAFAEATHASLRFQPDRVILTMEGESALPPPQAAVPPVKDRITKDFARTALAHLVTVREWKDAAIGVIQSGAPAGDKLQGFRERAVESLRQASVATSTNSDQNALQLVRNEFAYMQQWDETAATANHAMEGEKAVNPNFPKNDALLAKITDCHRFLNTMIVSGVFADSSACH